MKGHKRQRSGAGGKLLSPVPWVTVLLVIIAATALANSDPIPNPPPRAYCEQSFGDHKGDPWIDFQQEPDEGPESDSSGTDAGCVVPHQLPELSIRTVLDWLMSLHFEFNTNEQMGNIYVDRRRTAGRTSVSSSPGR